jgi:hypothetical protein
METLFLYSITSGDLPSHDLFVLAGRGNFTLAQTDDSGGLLLRTLGEEIRLDLESSTLMGRREGNWENSDDPLLELLALPHLISGALLKGVEGSQ